MNATMTKRRKVGDSPEPSATLMLTEHPDVTNGLSYTPTHATSEGCTTTREQCSLVERSQ